MEYSSLEEKRLAIAHKLINMMSMNTFKEATIAVWDGDDSESKFKIEIGTSWRLEEGTMYCHEMISHYMSLHDLNKHATLSPRYPPSGVDESSDWMLTRSETAWLRIYWKHNMMRISTSPGTFKIISL